MIIERDFAGRQFLGTRDEQQDAYAFAPLCEEGGSITKLLVVVADGMGGHTGGRLAATSAVDAFIERAFAHEFAPESDDTSALADALLAANRAVRQAVAATPAAAAEGMGTTLLAATITTARLQWVSVGDSPLLLCRQGSLFRLNADHSEEPATPREGSGKTASQGNILSAALSGGAIYRTDSSIHPFPLRPGDFVLCASDGIKTLTEADVIAAAANTIPPPEAAAFALALLAAAAASPAPKKDNLTVAAVRVG